MVTLIAVRNAVRTARSITLIQLIQQFDSEPQWLLTLLDDLIKRGKIERCEGTTVTRGERPYVSCRASIG